MREAIKMTLLKDAKGLGKTGKEFEVSTADQADYFERKGIAQRSGAAASLPLSSSVVDTTEQLPAKPDDYETSDQPEEKEPPVSTVPIKEDPKEVIVPPAVKTPVGKTPSTNSKTKTKKA